MIFVVKTKNQTEPQYDKQPVHNEDVTNGVKNMPTCANILDRYNTAFGTDDLNHGMLKGVMILTLILDFYQDPSISEKMHETLTEKV